VGNGSEWQAMAEDGRELLEKTRNGEGWRGTARVMSYEVKGIGSEVYDLNLASVGGPSARARVPYSPSGPHLRGHSLS